MILKKTFKMKIFMKLIRLKIQLKTKRLSLTQRKRNIINLN